jgi:PAS domain-containing protein
MSTQEPDHCVRLGSLLAEASPDALIAITPDAKIVYWNQSASPATQ